MDGAIKRVAEIEEYEVIAEKRVARGEYVTGN